jgi:tetratricopeptide (TPR) repeat protein
MKRVSLLVLLVTLCLYLFSLSSLAQVEKIVIPAGTPEDQALQAITNEQDAQKKLAMYEDFAQKFSSNPAAVAYGNWQISQAYQSAGDLTKALAYGDKALAGAPHNLDIIVSNTNIASQMKDNAKTMEYAAKGGAAYNGIDKQAKPEGMTDDQFKARLSEEKEGAKSSYEFLETAGFNVITDEKSPKARMAYIEQFTAAFPDSRFQEQVAQYAMYTLGPGQLNDSARLLSYGEKTLATNPKSIPALLLLANSYVEDTKPASIAKAVTYSQKVVELAKADAPDADRSRKLSGGMAHSTLGYAYMKQDKTAAAVPELKTAADLLKGQDDVSYAAALYRLGYAYAKLNKVDDARNVLNEVVKMEGPMQQPAKDLLLKVNTARSKAK